MNPLISVIVPVYKVEEYLDKCVQSIVNQTYENLEIILVDDGSPDNCPAMCDAWTRKDTRIRVIHQKNGGQADARNAGLAIASGAYIGFVDSDDWIHRDMYAHMMALALEKAADIVECGMLLCCDPAAEFPGQREERVTVFDRKDAVRCLLDESYFKCTVPNKLLKREIAGDIQFETGRINEDILWPYYAFLKAHKIVHTNRQLYAYYQRPGSTMNSSFTEKRLDGMYANEKRAQEVKRDFPQLYPLAERAYIGGCFYHYRALCRVPKTEETKRLKKALYERYKKGNRKAAFRRMGAKHRLYHIAFAIAPDFTSFAMNRLKIGL